MAGGADAVWDARMGCLLVNPLHMIVDLVDGEIHGLKQGIALL